MNSETDKKFNEMISKSENDFDMSESEDEDDTEDIDFMIYRINTSKNPNQILRYIHFI